MDDVSSLKVKKHRTLENIHLTTGTPSMATITLKLMKIYQGIHNRFRVKNEELEDEDNCSKEANEDEELASANEWNYETLVPEKQIAETDPC